MFNDPQSVIGCETAPGIVIRKVPLSIRCWISLRFHFTSYKEPCSVIHLCLKLRTLQLSMLNKTFMWFLSSYKLSHARLCLFKKNKNLTNVFKFQNKHLQGFKSTELKICQKFIKQTNTFTNYKKKIQIHSRNFNFISHKIWRQIFSRF